MKKIIILIMILSFSSCVIIAPRRPIYQRGVRPHLYSPRTHNSPFIRQHKKYKPYFMPGRW